ncbi:hypothetical protein EW093_17065 (plasmid) [Thiospirochaeta perfilievii]|uniref:Uncharacterized protein n=1 Tax=Thiospirochaeta perfilievii TaxID=252967 RepID=A0A5C1QFX7_9SPIO|nr:hypothetical protein [Thiospirochaeta perfilievii]QEN06421.1 hypothetical protein EW093_17065 [Thiospirochaeta perfilievii]
MEKAIKLKTPDLYFLLHKKAYELALDNNNWNLLIDKQQEKPTRIISPAYKELLQVANKLNNVVDDYIKEAGKQKLKPKLLKKIPIISTPVIAVHYYCNTTFTKHIVNTSPDSLFERVTKNINIKKMYNPNIHDIDKDRFLSDYECLLKKLNGRNLFQRPASNAWRITVHYNDNSREIFQYRRGLALILPEDTPQNIVIPFRKNIKERTSKYNYISFCELDNLCYIN